MFRGFTSRTRREMTAPAAIDEDLVEAAQANPVELVSRRERRLSGQSRTRLEARFFEEPSIRGIRSRIEIARDEYGIGGIARGDPIEDNPNRPHAGRLGQVEMKVVDPKATATTTVAKPDPCADPLGAESSRERRLIGRFLEPEGTAEQLLEASGVEIDRAVFTGRPAIISTDTDATIARKHTRDGLDLLREGFLHAKDIGPRRLDRRLEGIFPNRPSVASPGPSPFGAAEDVPGQDANGIGIRLGGRHGSARTQARPDDQPEPADQGPDENGSRHPEGMSTRPPPEARGLPRRPPPETFREREEEENRGDRREGPTTLPEGLEHEDRPRPAGQQDGGDDRGGHQQASSRHGCRLNRCSGP